MLININLILTHEYVLVGIFMNYNTSEFSHFSTLNVEYEKADMNN